MEGKRSRRGDPLRAELFFGAVYGLGLSSIIWAAVLFPPGGGAALPALLALAGVAGLGRPRLPRLGRCSPVPVVALAGLAVGGVAVGVLAAALTSLVAGLAEGPAAGMRPRHATFRAVTIAMAAFIAGLAYLAAGGVPDPPVALAGWLPALAHMVVFVGVELSLGRLAGLHSEAFLAPRGPRATWPRRVATIAGAPLAAAASVAAFRVDTLRGWAMIAVAGYLIYRLGRLRAESRLLGRGRRSRRLAIKNGVTRTLTRAISAGDRTYEGRLWRVQGLCLAVAERLELDEAQLEALGTAALLHDVGKVGVPEPALDHAGGLTAHELSSVRLHPAFGAEMLASLAMPDAVCRIVHHHHERWDGRGYPDGLAGNAIPVGARILAAVDNYDALTAERPGRRSVPASQVRRHLEREAGKTFDPAVIDGLLTVLDVHGPQLPDLVEALGHAAEPTATEGTDRPPRPAGAQQQLTTLYDLKRVTSYPIDLQDCLNLSAERLAQLIPHRALVVYVLDEDGLALQATFTAGQGADALADLRLPVGETLSGWAVRHRRAALDDDPGGARTRENAHFDLDGWRDDPRLAGLETTLTAPLTAAGECVGALTLYDRPGRGFGDEERRRLAEAAGYVAHAVQRARQTPAAQDSGHTDRLTGLPDGRFLLRDAAERVATSSGASTELGFLAFQVSRTTDGIAERFGTDSVERGLCQIARRLADHCGPRETLARFGPDTFVVVSPVERGEQLLERWNGFIHAVEHRPLELAGGAAAPARMVSAHAGYPADGDDLESVLSTLSDRLGLAADRGATIVPFRAGARSAS